MAVTMAMVGAGYQAVAEQVNACIWGEFIGRNAAKLRFDSLIYTPPWESALGGAALYIFRHST